MQIVVGGREAGRKKRQDAVCGLSPRVKLELLGKKGRFDVEKMKES